ncbi:hypothetical protein PSPO01_14657 [Paraphaeosphaeria sporulosa]
MVASHGLPSCIGSQGVGALHTAACSADPVLRLSICEHSAQAGRPRYQMTTGNQTKRAASPHDEEHGACLRARAATAVIRVHQASRFGEETLESFGKGPFRPDSTARPCEPTTSTPTPTSRSLRGHQRLRFLTLGLVSLRHNRDTCKQHGLRGTNTGVEQWHHDAPQHHASIAPCAMPLTISKLKTFDGWTLLPFLVVALSNDSPSDERHRGGECYIFFSGASTSPSSRSSSLFESTSPDLSCRAMRDASA